MGNALAVGRGARYQEYFYMPTLMKQYRQIMSTELDKCEDAKFAV